jgi:hypothetical protein
VSSTCADYREWLRIRIGVKTPREEALQNRSLWTADGPIAPDPLVPDALPPVGANPISQMDPSNYKLDSAIRSAAYKVTRQCRVKNAWTWTDINVPMQTATGPAVIHLDTLSGFPSNAVVSVQRAYWFDGQTYTPIRPALLQQLDLQINNYLNNGPGTPYQYAIEGNLLYLLPGPQADGVLRLTIGSGVLAPLTDLEGYGIPTAYDDAVNYNALLELAEIMPNDTEMTRRAQGFTDNAAQGLLDLMAYFDNVMLDEFQGSANFRTQVIRVNRRN